MLTPNIALYAAQHTLTTSMLSRLSKAFFLLLIRLMLSLVLAGVSLDATSTTRVFSRGIGIHNAMNWAAMEPKPSTNYVFPPFQGKQYELTSRQLEIIRDAGFDFIRLTLDPGPFLQFKGDQLKALDKILIYRVQEIERAGLGVIVDLHPNTQNENYQPIKLVNEMFPDYRTTAAHIAGLLAALNSNHVAIELMNEPQIGWNPGANALWQSELISLYDACRQRAPKLKIILSGGSGGSADGLMKVDPAHFSQDDAAIFSFHYYLPYEFTHQGYLPAHVLVGVPYPSLAAPELVTLTKTQAFIAELKLSSDEKIVGFEQAKNILKEYRRSAFGPDDIRKKFDDVSVWARKSGIDPSRIFFGEFGVMRTYGSYQGANDSDRAHWLSDVRQEAERHGFPWSVWVYKGYGGMALVENDKSDEFDSITLNALGLK